MRRIYVLYTLQSNDLCILDRDWLLLGAFVQ